MTTLTTSAPLILSPKEAWAISGALPFAIQHLQREIEKAPGNEVLKVTHTAAIDELQNLSEKIVYYLEDRMDQVYVQNQRITLTGDQDVTLFGSLIGAKKRLLIQLENESDPVLAQDIQHELDNLEALIPQAVKAMTPEVEEEHPFNQQAV